MEQQRTERRWKYDHKGWERVEMPVAPWAAYRHLSPPYVLVDADLIEMFESRERQEVLLQAETIYDCGRRIDGGVPV